MFSISKHQFLYVILCMLQYRSCVSEPAAPPRLVLYSPGEPEYTEVLVRTVHDNLTLVCELRGDSVPRNYVWNYVGANGTAGDRVLSPEPIGPASSSRLVQTDLSEADSGHYMCSAPPFSTTKYIAVQTRGQIKCARGAFRCGPRCVLVSYVCDGRRDCLRGEDEDADMCGGDVCLHPDKLNCSGGRCISSSACCKSYTPLCQQPACCSEHYTFTAVDGYVEAEYPPLYEDRRAPDDYGFIQSTIYTVTACALIFMIAVVLLVSAICKMQMKRAALRGYSTAAASHYQQHYHQRQRFPPCYETSRLLEQRGTDSLALSDDLCPPHPLEVDPPATPTRGLARLSNIFSSRYRQVPSHPPDVELRPLPPLPPRSPAYCDLPLAPSPTSPLASPTSLASSAHVTGDRLHCTDRLTLQVGRFQLSLPRFPRAAAPSPSLCPPPSAPSPVGRPPTPTVGALDLSTVNFVRVSSEDTYTLNGRTIRLLGAQFQCDHLLTPPSYSDAVRGKLYGPPPEYLSREGLNRQSADLVDAEAADNVEMPPCYDDLARSNDNDNGNNVQNNATGVTNNVPVHNNTLDNTLVINVSDTDTANGNISDVAENNVETLSSIIDNLPAIDDVNANDDNVNDTVINTDREINNSVINNRNANNVICNNNE